MEDLKPLATRLLAQSGNDVNKALPGFVRVLQKRPELLNTVAYNYLAQVAADVAVNGAADASGHAPPEAQRECSGPSAAPPLSPCAPHESAPKPKPKPVRVVPPIPKPKPEPELESKVEPAEPISPIEAPLLEVPVVAHNRSRPQRQRTQEEKETAIAAKMQLADAIYTRRLIAGRPVGRIRYCEGRSMLEQLLAEATAALNTSAHKVHDYLFLRRILDYATPTNPQVEFAEFISAEKLAEFDREAMLAVAHIVDRGKDLYAGAIREPQNVRSLPHAQ
jgi:hypothetical protein